MNGIIIKIKYQTRNGKFIIKPLNNKGLVKIGDKIIADNQYHKVITIQAVFSALKGVYYFTVHTKPIE